MTEINYVRCLWGIKKIKWWKINIIKYFTDIYFPKYGNGLHNNRINY